MKARGAMLLFALTVLSAAVSTATADHLQCPEMVGRWSWGASTTVVASEDFIYFDSQHGLLVADNSTSKVPRIVGEVTLGDDGLSPVQDLALEGGRVYGLTYHVLSVINVEDPTAPVEIGSIEDTGVAWGVAAQGDRVFLATDRFGLRGYNVEIPLHIFEVFSLDIDGVQDVVVTGTYAYVAAHEMGLRVIDLSDPNAPSQIGSVVIPWARIVAVDSGFAFVGTLEDGLWVVDISIPDAPKILGSIALPGTVNFFWCHVHQVHQCWKAQLLTLVNLVNVAPISERGTD